MVNESRDSPKVYGNVGLVYWYYAALMYVVFRKLILFPSSYDSDEVTSRTYVCTYVYGTTEWVSTKFITGGLQ